MDVFGKVVTVEMNIEIQKKDGSVYPGSRLTFRDANGKIQEQAMHANVLKFNPSIKAVLPTLNPGDDIVVVKEKKGDYWNVVGIKRADANSVTNDSPSIGSASKPNQTVPAKGNWETPEERAMRQVLIVRQSSLSSAVSCLTVGAKTPPKAGDVINLAKEFEAYVFGKQTDVAEEVAEFDFDDDEIPL